MASKYDDSIDADTIMDTVLDEVHREVTQDEMFKQKRRRLSCIAEEGSLGDEACSVLTTINENVIHSDEITAKNKRRGSAISEEEAKFMVDANDLIKAIQNVIAVEHQAKNVDKHDPDMFETGDVCEEVHLSPEKSFDSIENYEESKAELQSSSTSNRSSFEMLSDGAYQEGNDWFLVEEGKLKGSNVPFVTIFFFR